MFPVEIALVDESTMPAMMEKMRIWLDRRGFDPAMFRFSLASAQIVFRVEFAVEAEASAFAGEFGGTLLAS